MQLKAKSIFLSALTIFGFVLAGLLASAEPADARPRITTPKLNQQIGGARYYIRWTGERGMRSYYLRVREYGSPSYWINQPVKGTSFLFAPKNYNALGKRIQIYVYSCQGANGTQCGDSSTVSAYVMGPPVSLQSPADGATFNNPSRRPTFSWQSYQGFGSYSGSGSVRYKVTINGNGAAPTTYNSITGTSFQPPQPINPAYQNPVRWSVQACDNRNCSQGVRPRRLTLGGSSFDQLSGNVSFVSPPNGTGVDVGSQLRWQKKPGAAKYRICLNTQSSGCLSIRTQSAQPGSIQTYTLTAQDLNAKPPFGGYYFRGKRMYWRIQGCTQGNTQCVGTSTARYVEVAPAPSSGPGGGGGGGGGTPQVSFAGDFYSYFSGSQCGGCHASGNLFPQKTPRPSGCQASCGTEVIPFNSSISSGVMLQRLKCLKACSGQAQYSQAFGKTYVVPGNPSQSGLHHKAQESNSPIFGANVNIDGVTKPLREWIEIWISQGANP